ncbi:hypothetical protein BDV27DRAFT_164806 [Aspergillus caelatus]|uniref:Acyltransferase C-terminal domain-containing protein n=1 Tax=Aspergillus caelatus TaxID=61420 RepID=A0A5N6ZHL4_9EURO|nr:uncharacterized protein BDV27DRAFT_164806 [Aspergillus caelatus]KAE8357131.1 hypothetical protein BDV27DRAFT_164806 [Aspergillus caelatus]
MYWRRFAVSDIPLDDQKEFDAWLRARWTEKDQLLDEYFETGRFPSDLGGFVHNVGVSESLKAAAAAGYVEALLFCAKYQNSWVFDKQEFTFYMS